MTKVLLTLPITGASATVLVRQGERARILAFRMTIVPTGAVESGEVSFTTKGQNILTLTMGFLSSDVQTLSGAIGTVPVPGLLTNIDPVSGGATYAAELSAQNVALPDMDFDSDVQVSFALSNGAVGTGVLCYELTH